MEELLKALNSSAGTILAAGVALVGVIFANRHQTNHDKIKERNRFYLGKLEELGAAAIEAEKERCEYGVRILACDKTNISERIPEGDTHFFRCQILVKMHFPKLSGLVDEIYEKDRELHLHAFDVYRLNEEKNRERLVDCMREISYLYGRLLRETCDLASKYRF